MMFEMEWYLIAISLLGVYVSGKQNEAADEYRQHTDRFPLNPHWVQAMNRKRVYLRRMKSWDRLIHLEKHIKNVLDLHRDSTDL